MNAYATTIHKSPNEVAVNNYRSWYGHQYWTISIPYSQQLKAYTCTWHIVKQTAWFNHKQIRQTATNDKNCLQAFQNYFNFIDKSTD